MPDIFNAIPELEFAFRLLLAAGLGAVIGSGSQTSGKNESAKIFSLVSLGASLVTVISILGEEHFTYFAASTLKYNYDPGDIISQIVISAAILGVGAVIGGIQKEDKYLFAAGLWTASALGIATGLGMYFLATIAVVVGCAVPFTVEHLRSLHFFDRTHKENLNKDKELKYE